MRKRQWRRGVVIATALAAQASAVRADQDSKNEARAYGITYYRGPSHTPSECKHSRNSGRFSEATGYPAAFLGAFQLMAGVGNWDLAAEAQDTQVGGGEFTDQSKQTTATCSNYQTQCDLSGDDARDEGVDTVDVAFIITHGGANPSTGNLSWLMGDGQEDCSTTSLQNWRFGDGKNGELYALVSASCQVGSYEAFSVAPFVHDVTTTGGEFTMFNAFHGSNVGSERELQDLQIYSMLSVYDAMGDDWIDLMHFKSDVEGKDLCPTVRVLGASSERVSDAYWHAGWLDRIATGDKNVERLYWLEGCAPREASVLP